MPCSNNAKDVMSSRSRTHSGSKVKTGCATCRIRKVKCDEAKPSCQRCVNTGRTCDGYQSPFRPFSSPHNKDNRIRRGSVRQLSVSLPIRAPKIAKEEVHLLSQYFSTKTIFDVQLDCDDEARQVLHASLTDSSIQHAVSSLKALRQDLEISKDKLESINEYTCSYGYSLQQYCLALRGLASDLSSPSSRGAKSALLCCQIFISIEQARKDYAKLALHFTRGLNIMREYRARPALDSANKVILAHREQLPLLDVFIIKLFAAPCKYAGNGSAVACEIPVLGEPPVIDQQPVKSRNARAIAPDLRTQLTRISTLTLEFLDKISQLNSSSTALVLLSEKAALLGSLDSWLANLACFESEIRPPESALLSAAFMRFFHQMLRLVLMGALDSPRELDSELQNENDRFQSVADNLSQRFEAYRIWKGAV